MNRSGFTFFRRSAKHGSGGLGRSAEHGSGGLGRSAEHGFTLVELLVALLIFALLSAAGVMLLSGSVRAQGQIQDRLGELADVQRAAALMTSDLAQAVPRISRTRNGTLAPAFFAPGSGQETLVQFVRTGRDNPDGQPRSALQKLEYGLVAGQLVRRAYPQVDGAEAGPPLVLADAVTAATFRFRRPDGGWSGDWRPTVARVMPRAIELTLTRAAAPPLRLLFLVGPDPEPLIPVGRAVAGA